MSKYKDCPIPGCKHMWLTETGLYEHLYNDHRKADLIKRILAHLEG